MRKFLQRSLVLFFALTIVFTVTPVAFAANLVPCKDSPAFQSLRKNAPDNYYYNKPFEVYSSELLCGEDGLPHQSLGNRGNIVDVIIPIAIFLYTAGLIGWSGRAYLQAANRSKTPEQHEIFIDLPMALGAVFQGAVWPLAVIKELAQQELTVKNNEIPASPR